MTQQTRAQQPANQTSGAGCWLIGIITTLVALVLVVVGLFLPPFSLYDQVFGEPYTALQQAGDAAVTQDGSFRLAAATDVSGTFEVNLNRISLQAFETASAEAAEWVPAVKQAVPYYLALQSPVYTVQTRGRTPQAVFVSADIPGTAASPDLLDLYGWYETERGGQWEFVPSYASGGSLETTLERVPVHLAIFQAAPDTPEVLLAYDVSRSLSAEVADVATIVAPGGLQPTLSGAVTGSLAAGFDTNADYSVMPLVADYSDPRAVDTETAVTLISNSNLRREHVRQLTALAESYDGILLDYRGLPDDQRANFTQFIQELGRSLDNSGRMLGVVVPAADNENGVWQTGAYDWRALGQAVDIFKIDMGINPATYVPGDNQLVEAMLRWATGEVNRTKILLGLTAQSVREIGGSYTTIGYDEGLAGLGDVQVEAENVSETGTVRPGSEVRAYLDGRAAISGVDTRINAPYLEYLDDSGSTTARIWLTTPDALRFRMDWTVSFALGGVAFDDLLQSDLAGGLLDTIDNYTAQIPGAPAPTDLALRWRVEGTDGLINESTTGLNEDLVIALEAPDGNYAINASVVGIGEQSDEATSARTGAEVALFRPTPTPTPLPTATPTPIPTATPTPVPIVPTQPQASNPVSGGNTNPLAAGNINMGTFEYGGHATSGTSSVAHDVMRRAGMSWLKVQIRYYPGNGPDVAAGAIQGAKNAGFKVLIGTVGNPADLRAGGEGYLQAYANWLGGIAGLGADAVEVWNEPNIDREWPRDEINGAAYVDMLRRSYQAVKQANPNTMVISGAPAPTGAEAAYPGQVVNDDRWLRQMVNAGGLQYMDCVGVHYNEGIVGPTQTSGDPRGGYYTRYLPSMVNVYWNIVGGQRPLCFTELGYLTPEGYPPLPSYFAWGSDTSAAEQAAWLAQAAAYLSQSGRVRMMIVWNVEFRVYASDPQAGFAILRPDGSCPACDALAGAR